MEALDAPKGVWLLASALLGEPVSATGRYPHICGQKLEAGKTLTKTQNLTYRERDCAACARARRRQHSGGWVGHR